MTSVQKPTGPTGFPHLHSADLRLSQYPRGPGRATPQGELESHRQGMPIRRTRVA